MQTIKVKNLLIATTDRKSVHSSPNLYL